MNQGNVDASIWGTVQAHGIEDSKAVRGEFRGDP
ncbi:hypothetical protein EYZ11_006160 [Aspergillus tanneri]|uniref:Uncharacterized protein n=1 Tax=Aspergillus tanneri TaxID=1220188 RepID=A0A4S3JGH1_9EURO|nr:hypothetical protein EYZ11_006160 [Aspergillus tanneri]